jgi:hypothetical protein
MATRYLDASAQEWVDAHRGVKPADVYRHLRHEPACRWEEKGTGPCNCGRDKFTDEVLALLERKG